MITIFWSPNGIAFICALQEGERWTAPYFVSNVLEPLTKTEVYKRAKAAGKKLIVHMDNAPVHTAGCVDDFVKRHAIKLAPHPPYSPDLAPSDFYLFGALKSRLAGMTFNSRDEIVEWITDEFERIPSDELMRAFHNWQRRLEECSMSDGSYLK